MSDYEVIVLFDGYSKMSETAGEMIANCTCTLIKGRLKIIVDTMTAWDGDKIIEALAGHNLKKEDIDWVICTHGHSDHIGNNSLFLNATHMVGNTISKKDIYYNDPFTKSPEFKIDDGVKVIFTPGHTTTDVTVIVQSNIGIIAITGDLFERKEDLEDENIWMDLGGSEDPQLQQKNRNFVLSFAQYIVPGHGPMFVVPDQYRKSERSETTSV